MTRTRVYVAGPYSADNVITVLANMRRGIWASAGILRAGFAPFCPWLDYQFSLQAHVSLADYYEYGLAWLEVSDVVYVLDGWENSAGTLAELKRARELEIPIVHSMAELLAGGYAGTRGQP